MLLAAWFQTFVALATPLLCCSSVSRDRKQLALPESISFGRLGRTKADAGWLVAPLLSLSRSHAALKEKTPPASLPAPAPLRLLVSQEFSLSLCAGVASLIVRRCF